MCADATHNTASIPAIDAVFLSDRYRHRDLKI